MRRVFLFAASLALYVGWSTIGHARADEPSLQQLETQISILSDKVDKLSRQAQEKTSPLMDKYNSVKIREYEYQSQLMDVNMKTFSEQSLQTFVVMILVVIVVLSGILFSGFQLWRATGPAATVQPTTDLEISAKNIRVTSSVVGIVVLVISVIFLYIYIKEVYAIKFIDPFKPVIAKPNAP